jgi:hypothetical protein
LIPGRGDFLLFHSVQTGSGAHPASYSMGNRGSFLGDKAAVGMKLTTHLHLVVRLRMTEIYLHSPLRFHGVVLN